MSVVPIITFKAGICDLDQSSKPYQVKAQSRPGYIYLYSEDDLIHFCWRERSAPADEAELDLVMIPTDGRFVPYEPKSSEQASAKTNGRIFALKFTSSSQRHLFWLQSKPQGRDGDPAWFSPRDLKLGQIVDRLLQGEEFDVNAEIAAVRNANSRGGSGGDGGGEDTAMEDADARGDDTRGASGGAGADATGGDVRDEGEDSRGGGSDGARAATDAAGNPELQDVMRNFLNSLQGEKGLSGQSGQPQPQGKLFPLLSDLLETPTTVPMVESAPEDYVDGLLNFLPPITLILSQQGVDTDDIAAEPSAESVAAAKAAMSLDQKKALLKKVLRSPQFHQSLVSLSMALRDGGLPTIAEALGIQLENGGMVRGGSVPLGGGEAVEAFVEGMKKKVQNGS